MADANEPLDPYQCLQKPKRKYASEHTEVYLTKRGAETLSEKFSHFTNLEVMWLTGNRLSHLNGLELNIRVREVYVQDNRLVSLSGLKTFKFLKVLLASNNQLRNLDKQLSVLSKFSFLRKLDLFDNPAAEEPDYRLRAIYALPQVEVLDKISVKILERQKAEEVVPNIDRVTAARTEPPKRRLPRHTAMEKDCFREAAVISGRRRAEQERQMRLGFTLASTVTPTTLPPEARAVGEHRRLWSDPAQAAARELLQPSAWEQAEMRPLVEAKAGKERLTREETGQLVQALQNDGLDEVGRFLGAVAAVAPLQTTIAGYPPDRTLRLTSGPPSSLLDELFAGSAEDPEAQVPVRDVATRLLQLEWPRYDDDALDRRIARLYDEAVKAGEEGDDASQTARRMMALRLEGAKTRRMAMPALGGTTATQAQTRRKQRADLLSMTFNRGTREVDEATGQVRVRVTQERDTRGIGCY